MGVFIMITDKFIQNFVIFLIETYFGQLFFSKLYYNIFYKSNYFFAILFYKNDNAFLKKSFDKAI